MLIIDYIKLELTLIIDAKFLIKLLLGRSL